jgi:hypothetical protein
MLAAAFINFSFKLFLNRPCVRLNKLFQDAFLINVLITAN